MVDISLIGTSASGMQFTNYMHPCRIVYISVQMSETKKKMKGTEVQTLSVNTINSAVHN